MSKTKKIIMWSSITLVSLILVIVAFGYWFISLIPPGTQQDLQSIRPKDIPYLTENVRPKRGKILAVVTSTDVMGNTNKSTGYELTELSRAYYVFQANGFEVDIASPLGGEPPVVIDDEDMGVFDYAFLNDPVAQSKTKQSIAIEDVVTEDYQAIYFAGGKGAMFDFPQNKRIKEIVSEYYQSNKVIGAVCHGPAALIDVKLANGRPLLENKTITGFTNTEELFLIPDAKNIFPFLLQDKLVENGARFSDGIMYLENVTQDGNLVTGQNPWSTWTMTETMIRQLGYTPKPRKRSGDENAVDVLAVLETDGYSSARQKVSSLYSDDEQEFNRTLLAMHSIVAAMQWRLGKSANLIRLVAHAKSMAES